MKKGMRKFLSGLVPTGELKEWIKYYYYVFFAYSGISYGRISKKVYSVTINGKSIKSYQPYYHFIKEIRNYESFYSIKEGDVIIDAGANVGLFTLYAMRQVGPSGKVFAFEPDEINAEKLVRNVDLNPGVSSYTLERELLWSTEMDLHFRESGSEGSAIASEGDPGNVTVKHATSVDLFVKEKNLTKIDFIKMDIEGAEIEAMEGSIETIRKFRPNFAIASYHIVEGKPTYLAIEDFFRTHGYPFKTLRFIPNEYITFAGTSVGQ